MRIRRASLFFLAIFAAIAWMGLRTALAPAAPQAASQAPATTSGVIKAEANLVVVDVIATDKKGTYITDLDQKEFHVFEDDKEQPITSFSRAADAQNANPDQKRYLVFFFDNSTMPPSDQMLARQAAAKFVEKSASPNRLMAVVNFTGLVRVTQNFTDDANLLKRAVSGVQFSAVQPAPGPSQVQVASLGMPSLSRIGDDFGARSVLLAVREVAKMLRTVPGRKTLILFSGGFELTPERQSELTATIDALNKANIAVYAVDSRGLQGITGPGLEAPTQQPGQQPGFPPGAMLMDSPFPHMQGLWAGLWALPEPFQRPGGGGGTGGGGGSTGGGGGSAGGGGGGRTGGGGGTTGGGTSGGTGGGRAGGGGTTGGGGTRGGGTTGGNPTAGRGGGGGNPNAFNRTNDPYGCNTTNAYQNPNCAQRQIIPPILPSASTNQQVLYALANGTGGFTIFNTNDFLSGLDKIAKELSEYYVLGYVPPSQAHDGSYHSIRVRVDRKGVQVRSRNGYYDAKSPDLLAGKPEGKALEARATSTQPGDIPVSVRAPYFYSSPGIARVNLALEIPGSAVEFEKDKGKFHSQVNVLGIAYREDGSVAARFSDSAKLDLEKKEAKEFSKEPFPYRTNFDIAPGKYKLRLVLSAGGEKFAKYELPLTVDPFDGKKLEIGGPALSDEIQQTSQLTAEVGNALLEERQPLIFQGREVVPSTNNRFSRDDKVVFYVEVYDPLLQDSMPPRVGVLYNIVDRKTNQPVSSSNTIMINQAAQPGNPLVPFAMNLPMDQLQAGEYRLEILARDSSGNVSAKRAAEFAVE